jgi:hypothetical protein
VTRVWFEGVQLDTRTRDMFVRLRWRLGLPLVLTQGSYSNATASAGTHSGGGALDIRTGDLTTDQRARLVLGARQQGFAAWLRTPSQANPPWPYHMHGIAVGCPDLSAAARDQVADYIAGRNGLASNGPDDGPRGYTDMTWEKYQAAHPDEEWEMAIGDDILTAVKALDDKMDNFIATEASRYGVDLGRYKDLRGLLVEILDETEKAEEEGTAAPRYVALQAALQAIDEKVSALPKV